VTCRCKWADGSDELMRDYHDKVWGKPCIDEQKLFAKLCLDGAQAGLSWSCILHKQDEYMKAFDNFDLHAVSKYGESKVKELMLNPGIVRNRLKIQSVITNAKVVLELGSLSNFLWNYVDSKPIINSWKLDSEIPLNTELSDRISKDLKKLGFKFVGSTIIYAYMQAIGMVNDHIISCNFK
jgi:DNA-3-methyladenine glycosylase I